MILDFNFNTLKFGYLILQIFACVCVCVGVCMHVLVYPIRELQIDNRHTNETVHTA